MSDLPVLRLIRVPCRFARVAAGWMVRRTRAASTSPRPSFEVGRGSHGGLGTFVQGWVARDFREAALARPPIVLVALRPKRSGVCASYARAPRRVARHSRKPLKQQSLIP